MKKTFQKILCLFNRHKFIRDNNGIDFYLLYSKNIDYFYCEHCNKFKINFSNPLTFSLFNQVVKQKEKYLKGKRIVLFEKTESKKQRIVEVDLATGQRNLTFETNNLSIRDYIYSEKR